MKLSEPVLNSSVQSASLFKIPGFSLTVFYVYFTTTLLMAPTETSYGFGFCGFLLQIVVVLRAQLGVNTKVVGLIPVWAIHLRAGFMTLMGSFQTRTFCDSVTGSSASEAEIIPLQGSLQNQKTKQGEVLFVFDS